MRMLFLTDTYLDGFNLDHFRAAALQAFRDTGADVELLIANKYIDNSSWRFNSQEAANEFAAIAGKTDWDVVFNFNRAGMLPAVPFTSDDTPVLTWFIDSPERIHEGLRRHKENEQVFIPDETYLEGLGRQPGLSTDRVHYLQLGSTPDIVDDEGIDDEMLDRYRAEISFVGTFFSIRPLTLLLTGMTKPMSQKLIALAEDHLENYHTPMSELIEKHGLNLEAIPGVGGSLDEYLLRAVDDYQSSINRLNYLEAVADCGLKIYGNIAWADAAIRSLKLLNAYQFREAQPQELKYIYRASKVLLNICHVQAQTAVPLRIFDIVGSGGFLLSEHRADLTRILKEDEECAVFRTPEELREKSVYYLENEEARRSIAAAARKRIREEHMVSHRVTAMLETITTSVGG